MTTAYTKLMQRAEQVTSRDESQAILAELMLRERFLEATKAERVRKAHRLLHGC